MDFSEKNKLLCKLCKLMIFIQVFSDSAFWFHSATTRKLISLYKVISVSSLCSARNKISGNLIQSRETVPLRLAD
jgi:hypothetical protein